MRNLSLAVGALAEYLEEPGRSTEDTRRFALEAAREATALLEERNDLAIAALVVQIRSTAVDILRGPAWTIRKRWQRSVSRLQALAASLQPTHRGDPTLHRSTNRGATLAPDAEPSAITTATSRLTSWWRG